MAKHFQTAGIRPDAVLCSTSKRTRETFKLLAPALGEVSVSFDHKIYEASYQTLLERIIALSPALSSVLLIGHNPGVERLALFLMGEQGHGPGVSRLQEKFPTGSLAVLSSPAADWKSLAVGSCSLEDFVRPVDLDGEE